MTTARKFKLGAGLEDALEQMKPPAPPQDPDASKTQADVKKHQMTLAANAQAKDKEIQADMAMAEFDAKMEQQTEAWRQEVQARENAHQQQLELQRDAYQQQMDMQLQAFKEQAAADREAMKGELQVLLTAMNNARAVEVAEIGAATTLQASQISAANQASEP